MSEPGKVSRFLRYWVLPLVVFAVLGIARAASESSDSPAVEYGVPLAVLAIAVAIFMVRRRTAKQKAEAEGRTLPSMWEPTDMTLMDARPAFSNKAVSITFVSGTVASMLVLVMILSAEDLGMRLVSLVMWVTLGVAFATEVWVFSEYVRRVNAGVASRSMKMLARLVFLFAFPQIIVAMFLAIGLPGLSSASTWLSTAWFVNGVLVPTGLSGLAMWLTRGQPLETQRPTGPLSPSR